MADDQSTRQYEDPDKLSTEALEEIIRADLLSDTSDVDYIIRVLEVIEQRKGPQADDTVDVEAAWEIFCNEYYTEEGAGLSLYDCPECCGDPPGEDAGGIAPEAETAAARKRPRTIRFVFKRVGLAAAVLVLLLAGMFTVQAAGVDIFGVIARWTDEVFHFETTGTAQASEWSEELSANGVDPDLIAAVIPDGFEAKELTINDYDTFKEIQQRFTEAGVQYVDICIKIYESPEYIPADMFEKDSSPVEQYSSNGRIVYLFSNLDSYIVVCLDGLVQVSVTGNIAPEQIKQIFDSIGGT